MNHATGHAICRIRIHTILSILLALFVVVETSSAQHLQWERKFSGAKSAWFTDVLALSDGGIVGLGETRSSRGYRYDQMYVVKLSATGETEWERSLEGQYYRCNAFTSTSDGGFVITGSASSDDTSKELGEQLLVLRTDASGEPIWQRLYGDTLSDVGMQIITVSDGGYLIAGYVAHESWGRERSELYLLRLSENGDQIWDLRLKLLDDVSHIAKDIIEIQDGAFLIAGYIQNWVIEQPVAVKVSSTGAVLSSDFPVTRAHKEMLFSFKAAEHLVDNGFLFTGRKGYSYNGGTDAYIIRTDADLNIIWEREIDIPGYESDAFGIVSTGNQCVIAAKIGSNRDAVWNSYRDGLVLLAYDLLGDSLWSLRLDSPLYHYFGRLVRTADNAVAIGSTTTSPLNAVILKVATGTTPLLPAPAPSDTPGLSYGQEQDSVSRSHDNKRK